MMSQQEFNNTNVHLLQTDIMQKPTEPLNSPFRQKIFDLMKQQQTSKILKISRKFQNKTNNTSHSPFRQFSIDTEIIDESKICRLDTSGGALHFKSLQQKLGLKNVSHSRSNGKKSNSKSQERNDLRKVSRPKKVSFIQDPTKSYYKPNSNMSKSKDCSKKKKENSLQKSNSSRNLKKYSSSKDNSKAKSSANQSIRNSSKNLKVIQTMNESNNKKNLSSTANYNIESNEKETEKKNYLLQTLKKMESVRKNLSKTFQQFDKNNNDTQRSKDQSFKMNKSKQKSKSNLTVISDYVNEENQSSTKYQLKNNFSNTNKSKSKPKSSRSKVKNTKNEQNSTDIFHKKTPTKRMYLNASDSLSGKISDQKPKSNSPIDKQLLKQIRNSCKNPQKWQTILKNELISIHFRVVKRKLIEIEIHAETFLETLELQLDKAHFICQSLKENYTNVKRKEIITLLCSVRGIQTSNQDVNLFRMPKLYLNIAAQLQGNDLTFNKEIDLPYTWIMLIEKVKQDTLNQSSSKKSSIQISNNRIKTRSRLEGIEMSKQAKSPNLLQIFSFYKYEDPSANSVKKEKKKNSNLTTKDLNSQTSLMKFKDLYVFNFELEDQQFKLFVKMNTTQPTKNKSQQARTFDLELQGKGQNLMNKIVSFLEVLK